MTPSPTSLLSQPSRVDPAARARRNGHRGAVVWLTGLPGAGKTTLALAAEAGLHAQGWQVCVLDGDSLRQGLCAGLGFSLDDRRENMRRVGEAARLFAEHGSVALVALVSPLADGRDAVRQRLPAGQFLEVYCRCPLEVCRQRDPKGMYARAAAGLIADFTGISSPYEPPLQPELVLDTAQAGSAATAAQLIDFVQQRLRWTEAP